jgi:hypothetical protein
LSQDTEELYIREIKTTFDQIKSKFPRIDNEPKQFLFWFMWVNFDWKNIDTSAPPKEVLMFLCDNGNDQSIDGFYFSDDSVEIVQSKYTKDWRAPSRITYNELKRTADIRSYFHTGDTSSVVFQKANQSCRRLLTQAYSRITNDGLPLRIYLASNKLDPTEANWSKLLSLDDEITEENFEIISRPKIVQLWAQFLEGHNPPIPRYFIKTLDAKYVYVASLKKNLEAYVTATTAGEIATLYNKFRERIFEKNVRAFLQNVPVNREIAQTLTYDPDMFFFRNSGLTILCSRADPVPPGHGAEAGFWIKDIQIINGQQTTRRLAADPKPSAEVLLTIIGPRKAEGSPGDLETRRKRELTTSIIAARNFQSRVGFADLKANDPIQVSLWRAFRDRGYYYERKKKAWLSMDQYARTLYPLACRNSWAVIKKERLAAETVAIVEDPQLGFQGADFIFREKYNKVFPKRGFGPDYYIALHLIANRYVYKIGNDRGETYPLYHVLRFIVNDIGLSNSNARLFRHLLEKSSLNLPLRLMTKALYQLSDLNVREIQRQSGQTFSFNDVFGKRKGVQQSLRALFRSRRFAKGRKKYEESMSKLRRDLRTLRYQKKQRPD